MPAARGGPGKKPTYTGGKGGTADYLSSSPDSSEFSPEALPDAVSSKARLGSPLAIQPAPVLRAEPISLRERKPKPAEMPAEAAKKQSKKRKADGVPPAPPDGNAGEAALKRPAKYAHTAEFLEKQAERAAAKVVVKENAKQASLSAKRVASQMKALTTGANAPNFDISGKVEILPSEKGSRAVPNPDPHADHDTAVCTRTCGR